MGRRYVEATAMSAAPPEKVWQLLADVTTWTSWGAWDEARREGEVGKGERRFLRRGRTSTVEQVVAFEPSSRLAYRLVSGLPVRDYEANVTLAPLSNGGTRIVWSAAFEGRWPVQGRIVAWVLGRFFPDTVRRLASAAEGTG